MATYKLTNTGSVIRIEDSAYIPADPANTDYIDYQAWLADGNVPIMADPIDPNAQIDAQIRALEGAAPIDRAVREFMILSMIDRFKQTPQGSGLSDSQVVAKLTDDSPENEDYAPGFDRAWKLDQQIAVLRHQRV